MEDKTLLEALERIGNDCKFVSGKLNQDKFTLLTVKGEIRRLEDNARKLKEENEIVRQQIELEKQNANSIIEMAKEESEKIKSFAYEELKLSRINKSESEKLLNELKLQKEALKV